MGAITIRRLDNAVIERLKTNAKIHGRSMEEEARVALTNSYRPALSPGQNLVDRVRAQRRAMFGDRVFDDNQHVLRDLREADPASRGDE